MACSQAALPSRSDQYQWKYLIVLTEDDLPSVHEEFEALMPLGAENHLRFYPSLQPQTRQDFRWMNDISYVDSEKREHVWASPSLVEGQLRHS
jgi:hypothetical protein